jgi:hypothetical protein
MRQRQQGGALPDNFLLAFHYLTSFLSLSFFGKSESSLSLTFLDLDFAIPPTFWDTFSHLFSRDNIPMWKEKVVLWLYDDPFSQNCRIETLSLPLLLPATKPPDLGSSRLFDCFNRCLKMLIKQYKVVV